MPSTPFDTAHQNSLRMLIGKVLPGVGAQSIAEAIAAGYGFSTHVAFGEAIRAVRAGRPAPVHDFDANRLIGRLHALGKPVGEQDEALRSCLASWRTGHTTAHHLSGKRRMRCRRSNACAPSTYACRSARWNTWA